MKPDELIYDYYNTLAPIYDSDRFGNSYGQFIDAQEREVLGRLFREGKGVALDMGCGTGRFMEFAGYGVDFSPEMIRLASEKHPGKSFAVADIMHTPFGDEFFDRIFSLHVFMHLPQEKTLAVLNEARRILCKGGILVFDFPSRKRRRWTGRTPKKRSWHGASAYDITSLVELAGAQWKLRSYTGIMFFPVHRFPKFLRRFLLRIDTLLCRSFIREYASYLIVVLEKQ